MPKSKWKSLTVPTETYDEIREMAKKRHHTARELVEIWLEQEREMEQNGGAGV